MVYHLEYCLHHCSLLDAWTFNLDALEGYLYSITKAQDSRASDLTAPVDPNAILSPPTADNLSSNSAVTSTPGGNSSGAGRNGSGPQVAAANMHNAPPAAATLTFSLFSSLPLLTVPGV